MAYFQIPLKDNFLGLIQKTLETSDSQPLNSAVDLDGVAISTKGAVSLFPGRTEKITTGLGGRPVKYQTFYTDANNDQIPILYVDNGTTAEWFRADYDAGTVTSLGTVTANAKTVNCRQVRDLSTGDRVLIMTSDVEVPKKSVNLGALANLGGWPPNYVVSYSASLDLSEISEDPNNFSVPTKPPLLESHKNKIWLADGIFEAHSETFAYELWTNNSTTIKRAGWIQINPGDLLGDIIAIARWQDVLVTFKKRAIYLTFGSHSRALTGTTTDGDPFRVIRTPSPVGIAGPYAWDYLEDDIVFMDNLGEVRLLSQAILKDQGKQRPLSELVKAKFQAIPEADRKNVIIKVNSDRKHVWVGYHDGNDANSNNNAVGLYDYQLKNWTFIHGVIKPASFLFLEDRGFYVGTYDGKIHKQYDGTTHGLTNPTLRPAFYTLPWISHPKGNKFRIKALEMWFASIKAGKVMIEVTWQNRQGQYYDIIFTSAEAEGTAKWDSATWDTDVWGSGSGRSFIKKVIKPRGSGFKAQIKIYSSQEDFAWTWAEGIAHCESFGRVSR